MTISIYPSAKPNFRSPQKHPEFAIALRVLVDIQAALLMVLVLGLGMAWSSTALAQANPPAAKPAVPPNPARLSDGTPNWTGFWVPLQGLLENYRGPSFLITNPNDPSRKLLSDSATPMKSPYKELYAQRLKDSAAGKPVDPTATCLPPGMPRMMTMVYGMEVLQTPGQIAITSEWQAASRRVWLDRNTHPDPDELDPSYAGDSIGHWEGDTLVVDTVGIRNDVVLDSVGLPISDKLHVIERFKQVQPGILQDEITIDDADAFTGPWKIVKMYRYRPELRIKEYVCLENNRNVGPDGQAVFH